MAELDIARDERVSDEIVGPQTQLRELGRAALDVARERADLEDSLVRARSQIESARAELPIAERTAKTRRQSQLDAVRGRADLERRLQSLVESEALARTRRQQAEQRAQGFRAAATFAASGRAEAGAGDTERLERERLVEARAMREASVAESRAAEERAEEQKIGKLRAELEMHVAAEREVEIAFALERDEAERRSADLHREIQGLAIEIRDADVALEALAETAERIALEHAAISEQFDDHRRATRENIELRIAELRAIEAATIRERTDLEEMLATLMESEAVEAAVSIAADAADAADFEVQTRASDGSSESASTRPVVATADSESPLATNETEPSKAPLYVAKPAQSKAVEKPKTIESFIRPERTPYRSPIAAPKTGDEEELIPGLKSLVGNIFTRKRPEAVAEPIEPEESSSIADRIARDFGLLGGGDMQT